LKPKEDVADETHETTKTTSEDEETTANKLDITPFASTSEEDSQTEPDVEINCEDDNVASIDYLDWTMCKDYCIEIPKEEVIGLFFCPLN
jgi:hypothetical protein